MRSTDERVEAVKKRTHELEYKRKIRNSRFISIASVFACFVFLIGMSFVISKAAEHLSPTQYITIGEVASVFSTGNAIGYIFIALIAFVLGVCVTVLSMFLHKKSKEARSNDRSN